MPCIHHIDLGKGVVFVKSTGHVTDGDWTNNLMAMASNKDFHRDLRGFSDYTEVTASSVSAEMIILLAANPASAPTSRWAFLIKPGLNAAMIEFYKLHLRHGQIELFTDRAQAVAWLNDGMPAEKRIE